MAELDCWIVGDSLTNRFLVKIDSNRRVMDLQRTIKEKRFAQEKINGSDLVLWEVRASTSIGCPLRLLAMCIGVHTAKPMVRGENSGGNERHSTRFDKEVKPLLYYPATGSCPHHRMVGQIDSLLLDCRRRNETNFLRDDQR